MRQQSVLAVGDVIRLDGVTKTCPARLSGGERQLAAGPWPDRPGQVVLDGSQVPGLGGNPQVGSTLSVTGAPGASALTVVGYANSVTNTADGWVTPGEVARLEAPGAPASTQMLYRFAPVGRPRPPGRGAARRVMRVTVKRPPPPRPGALTWDP